MFKFKKKLTAILLAASMMLSICGCSKTSDDTSTDTTEQVTIEQSTDTDATEGTESEPAMADPTSPEALEEQEKFDAYLQESFEESVVSATLTLHYTLAHPENYGITPPEVTYGDTDISEEAFNESKQDTEDEIAELEEFDYDLLTADQKFTYDILYEYLQTDILSYENPYLYEPFAYTSGLHSNLPITLAEYTFYDQEDVDDYLELLALTPDYFQACLDFEQIKIEKGLFMNTQSANEVIRQCSDYIANPEENLLIETFNVNIEEVPGLTAEQIEEYKQKNYDSVMEYIIPTYEKTIAFFKQNKNAGQNNLGLAHFDGGTEYYEYLIKNNVGSDKTPEEIIELLDESVEDLMSDFYSVAMNNYDAYTSYYEDMDSQYEDVDPKETIEYFEDATSDRFPDIPDIDFTIEPVHESLEDIVSPAFFMTPPLDDYENNSIYTNLNSDGAGSLWSTLAHEGVPGHMYQFVYFLSNEPEPIRCLLNFNGYQEGWATYVELMSFDYYDGYSNDAYADLERINTELNLLVSARIEIGVNYEGWDLEETQNYLTENGFNGAAAQDIMDYVIAEPANYQMYVLGWLEFKELKEYAESELGDKFDECEFHKVLLDAGPCQFYLLRDKVEEYVSTTK